jgi:hypothetical protein
MAEPKIHPLTGEPMDPVPQRAEPVHSVQQQPATLPTRNPYLVAMLWIAGASFGLGLILFLTGVGYASTSFDPDAGTGQMLFGSSLLSLAVLMFIAWLVVSAINWQSDRAGNTRRGETAGKHGR